MDARMYLSLDKGVNELMDTLVRIEKLSEKLRHELCNVHAVQLEIIAPKEKDTQQL